LNTPPDHRVVETAGDSEIGALRGLSLAASVSLVGATYLLSGWACSRYNVLSGEGQAGMVLAFAGLPLVAGGLAWFATRPLGTWVSLVIALEVSGGAFAVAMIGC
jgi:hypothetical protein